MADGGDNLPRKSADGAASVVGIAARDGIVADSDAEDDFGYDDAGVDHLVPLTLPHASRAVAQQTRAREDGKWDGTAGKTWLQVPQERHAHPRLHHHPQSSVAVAAGRPGHIRCEKRLTQPQSLLSTQMENTRLSKALNTNLRRSMYVACA